MRATYRCSRSGSARHNDRNFNLDKATHIDQRRTAENCNWHLFMRKAPDLSFSEMEKIFYTHRYSAHLEALNSRYKAQYHPERCKTIDDLLKSPKTRPEEVILQIGNMDNHPNPDVLMECMVDYVNKLAKWNVEHGNHLHILNFSIHLDESTPHVHLRRCWDYIDKDGNPRIGQEQALKAAGLEAPDPSKPIGRYNNRKMTFDSMMRGKWQEILKEHGLEIETDPLPRKRNMITEKYIDSKIAQKSEQIEKLEKQLDKLERQVEWTKDLRDTQRTFKESYPQSIKEH